MNKLLIRIVIFLFLLTAIGAMPRTVSAAVCDENDPGCVMSTCSVLVDLLCVDPNDPYFGKYVCGTYWDTQDCCTYPQSGGGSCTCCAEGGCYLNCPGPTNTPNNTPGVPTRTPTPTPTPPPNPATVLVRGVVVPSTATTCTDVWASTTYVNKLYTLSPINTTKGAADGAYATWSNLSANTYTVSTGASADYVLKFSCWKSVSPAAQGTGLGNTVIAGETLTYDLGYTVGTGWWQVDGGGDVYAGTDASSYIPSGATPQKGILDGAGTVPGVVTYGSSYDFDSDQNGLGETYVSSTDWLAQDAYADADYYAIMYHRFGSPAVADYTGPKTFTSKAELTDTAPLNGSAYYINGDMTIDTANWVVGGSERNNSDKIKACPSPT